MGGKFDFDVVGHYSRPDVFRLEVNERPMTSVEFPNEDQHCEPPNFRIHYTTESEYELDFVAETADSYYLCEPKAFSEIEDDTVQAKARAAAQWCKHATSVSSKPWKYLLIPHTTIDESKSIAGLAALFEVHPE